MVLCRRRSFVVLLVLVVVAFTQFTFFQKASYSINSDYLLEQIASVLESTVEIEASEDVQEEESIALTEAKKKYQDALAGMETAAKNVAQAAAFLEQLLASTKTTAMANTEQLPLDEDTTRTWNEQHVKRLELPASTLINLRTSSSTKTLEHSKQSQPQLERTEVLKTALLSPPTTTTTSNDRTRPAPTERQIIKPQCNQYPLRFPQQQQQKYQLAHNSNSDDSNKVHKHAFIAPYRNRKYHYEQFVQFMNDYIAANYNLSTNQFSLWVIEQDDQEPFNRGWLANVGLAEIFRNEPDTQCITFHDIDLIPDTNTSHVKGPVFYDQCQLPTQIGSELSHFNWGVPYLNSAGGVTTLHAKHWQQINGFSNDFVGWGGEDDDYFLRIKYNNLLDPNTCTIHRPPLGFGRFRTISQKKDHHEKTQISDRNYAISTIILQQMNERGQTKGNQRWMYDGLSDLQYTVSSREETKNTPGTGFTHLHHIHARQQLLEFVHIPKTAGSAIEKAAGKAGIPWGACHFHHALNKEMKCPDPPNFENLGLVSTLRSMREVPSLWLVPPHRWNVDLMQSKRTFTVVRNPYDLALSIYYDKWVGYTGEDKEDPAALNTFLRHFYANPPSPVFKLPQGAYVYDRANSRRRQKMVDHVLKYENLASEFAALMQQYNLCAVIQLPDTKFNQAPPMEGTKKLGRQNLTESTLQLIEKHYGQDFDLFNYTRMSQQAGLEQGPKAHQRRKFTKGIKPSNGGGLFYCGHLDTVTQVGQAIFPDYAHRYEGGYDFQSRRDIGTKHPRRKPKSDDILIHGMQHGPCATPLQDFPGKVLIANGEARGGDITQHTVFKEKHLSQSIFQIGSVPDSNSTALSYFVVWDLRRLYDHNQKPTNTGKHNAMVYTNSYCTYPREQAVNRISAVMPIHVGGTCQGARPHKGTFLPAPMNMSRGKRKHNHELYKDYKFCFAMENTYQDQYITGKILYPFLAGCIPIYYGTKEVFNIFNQKAMVHYDPINPDPALKQLQELQQNETLYNEMLHNQPILAHGNETLRNYFSLLDEIEGGHLKHRIRSMMGVKNVAKLSFDS